MFLQRLVFAGAFDRIESQKWLTKNVALKTACAGAIENHRTTLVLEHAKIYIG